MKYLLSHRTSYSYASSVDSAHHIAHLRARLRQHQRSRDAVMDEMQSINRHQRSKA